MKPETINQCGTGGKLEWDGLCSSLYSSGSLQLLLQDYLDPGHYSLGVFASQASNFTTVPQMLPSTAAKQMSSFMRMLLDPERPLTPACPPPHYVKPPSPRPTGAP